MSGPAFRWIPETGLAFLPVSSPSPNYYGGDRLKEMPLCHRDRGGECRDRRGEMERASWSITTSGTWTSTPRRPWWTFRRTARPFPPWCRPTRWACCSCSTATPASRSIRSWKRPYPASDVQGEVAAKTQPFVPYPEPLMPIRRRRFRTLADLVSFGECSRWKARIRDEGRYTPPSLRGSISWPATVGGVEWGGGAVDPTTNTYVVNTDHGAADLHPGAARRGRQDLWQGTARPGRLLPRSKARPMASGWRTSSTCGACPAGRRLTARLSSYD